MIHIAICDDNIEELESIYVMLTEYQQRHDELDFHIKKFQSGYDLIESLRHENRFELCILNMSTTQLNGIEIGAVIRQKNMLTSCLYLVPPSNVILHSAVAGMTNYLIKPIEPSQLFCALDKSILRLNEEPSKVLKFDEHSRSHSIPFMEVLYIEFRRFHTTVHIKDGSQVSIQCSKKRFNKLISQPMLDDRFLRISPTRLINMQYVRGTSSQYFIMSDGRKLTFSKKSASNRQVYIDYVLGRRKS